MKRKLLAAILTVAMTLNVFAGFAVTNAEGTFDDYGFDTSVADAIVYEEPTAEEGVYQIENAGQLYWFAQTVNAASDKTINAKLVADIDMSVGIPDGITWTPIASTGTYGGTGDISDYGYTGTFDGNNNTISNLTVPSPGAMKSAGLFGTVSGTVNNLEIDGFTLDTADDLRGGAIAGQVVTNGLVKDCLVKNSSVTIPVAGAAVGANYDGLVENVLVLDSSASGVRTGMIIGDNNNDPGSLRGTINNCYTDGAALTSSQSGTVNTSEAGISDTRLASGEIACKLNYNRVPVVWGQIVDLEGETPQAIPELGGVAVSQHGENYYSNNDFDPEAALASAKVAAIDELNNYLDLSKYRDAQKTEINSIISDASAAINSAEDADSVATLKVAALAELDEVKTDVELREDDWNTDKENGLVKNLVLNDSFDNGTTYWDMSNAPEGTEVLAEQFGSTNVLKIAQGSGYVMQVVSVKPGKLYKFSYEIHTTDGLPTMGVYAYDYAKKATGNALCGNNWNQPGEWLENRTYQFYDSSAGRAEYFSAEGDVVAIVFRASGSAPVYIDNVKLEGVAPDANKAMTNMVNNMVAGQEFSSTEGTQFEVIQKDGRETVHMYTTLNEETGLHEGYGTVYRWTRVIPGRKYVASGWKQTGDNGQLERINLYTVDEEGNLLNRISDQNWGHTDSRHYVLGNAHISHRDNAYVPGDDVYGIAVAVENNARMNGGANVSETWYGDLAIYDVTESYEFDDADVPTVTVAEGVTSSVTGNTIDIAVDADEYTVDVDSYDGSKVEYYSDAACGVTVEPVLSGLSGKAKTIYAKVYSRYNAQARVYTVNVTKAGAVVEPEPTPTAEPTEAPEEPTVAPTTTPDLPPVEPTEPPVVPTEEPVEPTEEPAEPTEEPAVSENLVVNYTFADGVNNWNTSNIAEAGTEGVDDESSLKIIGGSAWASVQSDSITIEPNTDYKLTLFKKGTGNVSLSVDGFDGIPVFPSSKWEKVSYYFNSGDKTSTKISLTETTGNAIELYVDRVYLTKASESGDELTVEKYLGENLLQNGDMEEVSEEGKPLYWGVNPAWGSNSAGSLDGRGLGINGSNALRINENCGYDIQQGITIADYIGKTLRFSFKAKFSVKGEGFEQWGNWSKNTMAVCYFGGLTTYNWFAFSEDEWTEFTFYADVTQEAIDSGLGGTFYFKVEPTHEMLIDDVSVCAVMSDEEVQALLTAKETALNTLDTYKSADDYREAQKTELANAIAEGKKAVEDSKTTEDVATALANAKAVIDAIKTDAQLTAEELQKAKDDAKAELDAYKSADDYRDAEKTTLADAITAGKAAIDACTVIGDVATALTNAKTAMDAIKTDAQLTAEELQTAKADAKAALDAYKNPDDYRDAQKEELAQAIEDAKAAIDAATDVAGVESALATAKGSMDEIKTDEQLKAEEEANATPTPTAEPTETPDVEEPTEKPTEIPEETPGTDATTAPTADVTVAPTTAATPGATNAPGVTVAPTASATTTPDVTPTPAAKKVKKVKFVKKSIKVKKGKKFTVKVKLTPKKLTKAAKKVKWSINKKGKKVVKFVKKAKKLRGKLKIKLKALKKGKAKVTCKAPSGKKAVCKIVVK